MGSLRKQQIVDCENIRALSNQTSSSWLWSLICLSLLPPSLTAPLPIPFLLFSLLRPLSSSLPPFLPSPLPSSSLLPSSLPPQIMVQQMKVYWFERTSPIFSSAQWASLPWTLSLLDWSVPPYGHGPPGTHVSDHELKCSICTKAVIAMWVTTVRVKTTPVVTIWEQVSHQTSLVPSPGSCWDWEPDHDHIRTTVDREIFAIKIFHRLLRWRKLNARKFLTCAFNICH